MKEKTRAPPFGTTCQPSGGKTWSRNSALQPLRMHAAKNSDLRKNKTQQRETLANPAVNYFTGNSI